jgi:hypothetical protein
VVAPWPPLLLHFSHDHLVTPALKSKPNIATGKCQSASAACWATGVTTLPMAFLSPLVLLTALWSPEVELQAARPWARPERGLLYWPLVHVEQEDAEGPDDLPVGQSVQAGTGAPGTDRTENLPLGQDVHEA